MTKGFGQFDFLTEPYCAWFMFRRVSVCDGPCSVGVFVCICYYYYHIPYCYPGAQSLQITKTAMYMPLRDKSEDMLVKPG